MFEKLNGMVENAGCGIQDIGCGIRGAGSVENAKSVGMQGWWKMRGRWEMRGLRWKRGGGGYGGKCGVEQEMLFRMQCLL